MDVIKLMYGMYLRRAEMLGESEADQFQGTIKYINGDKKGETQFQINTYSKSSGAAIAKRDTIKMAYVSPCDHLRGNIINQIIRSDGYKEICIRALQLFDQEIEDILFADFLKDRKKRCFFSL